MGSRLWRNLMILALVVLTGILLARWAGLRVSDLTPERIRTLITSFGVMAPLIYFLVYAQPIIPLPISVLAMAAGLAFGLAGGMVLTLAAATVRGCGQFLIARTLGREAVASRLKGRLASLDQWIRKRSLTTVIWVRIIPNVPYDMQNYALGFSPVPFSTFALGTFVGMIPSLFAWVSVGSALSEPKHRWTVAAAIAVLGGLWFLQHRFSRRGRPSSR
jgi:uncharacterized membrane protein YdjX (TVP38/TMEM64 family)